MCTPRTSALTRKKMHEGGWSKTKTRGWVCRDCLWKLKQEKMQMVIPLYTSANLTKERAPKPAPHGKRS